MIGETAPNTCPSCGSFDGWNYIGEVKEGISGGKAVAGGLLFGGIGMVAGAASGKKAYQYHCSKCGLINTYKNKSARTINPSIFQHISDSSKRTDVQSNNIVKETSVVTKTRPIVTGDNYESVLTRIVLFLEDREWEKAEEYCEAVLDYDPKCSYAYILKLMIKLKVSDEKLLSKQNKSFANDPDYLKAIRFATEEERKRYEEYLQDVVKRNEFVIQAGVLKEYNGVDTKVIVPDNVISIGKDAFRSCSGLTEVILPDGLKQIGEGAFSGCKKLSKISFPNSLTSIAENAFLYCESLCDIKLPNNLLKIESGTFSGCINLSKISFPEGLTSIGGLAFSRCKKLCNILLPNSVSRIGIMAFSECESIREISLPDSLIEIGSSAFKGCINLEKIKMPNNDCTLKLPINAFLGCTKLTEVIIPNMSWMDVLGGSAYYKEYHDNLIKERKQANLCLYCGGNFKGIFKRICSKCGKEKDY